MSNLHTAITAGRYHVVCVREKGSEVYKGGMTSKLFQSLSRFETVDSIREGGGGERKGAISKCCLVTAKKVQSVIFT